MKLASWNVNSIRAREARVLEWLRRERPDVLCLQELKVETEEFPYDAVGELGYEAAVYGQKTYNGVAILSRASMADVIRGMGESDSDPQARLVSAEVGGIRVMSAYFPNGQMVGSEQFEYKLEWITRLREYVEAIFTIDTPLVIAGDFNVAPRDVDVHNPLLWGGSVLCHEYGRDALRRLREWGFEDVLERLYPEGGLYTWWDYQLRAFEKDHGLRIDHIYATRPLAAHAISARVDRDERVEGTRGKPSDHAPLIAEFD